MLINYVEGNVSRTVSINSTIYIHLFYLNDKLPKIFKMYFTPTSTRHKYNTRFSSKNNYSLPLAKTNYGKFSIRFAGATLWNSLDENLEKEKKKTLRANYLIPSLVAINRNNLIKLLIIIFILNLLPIALFSFCYLCLLVCYFNFFFFFFSFHLCYSYSCKKKIQDSFLTL